MNTSEPRQKPQFTCRYCNTRKFEIERLPTSSRQGHYVCAECDDKRNAAIKRNKSDKIVPWKLV